MLFLVAGFLAVVAVAVIIGTTRVSRLKRLSRTFNARYQVRVDTPLTLLSVKQVKLFQQGFHRFSHVLTWKDGGVFIRACDDSVYASPSAKASQISYTLWTAELARGGFVPFTLSPRGSNDLAAHPALPPELAVRYTLLAPADYRLPAELISLLQSSRACYVETTLYSLVYHEYRVIPVSQMQQASFHVKTFVKFLSLAPKITPAENASKTSLSAEQLQINAMLTLQNRSRTGIAMPSLMRLFYVIGAFLIVTGLLVVARYFLQTLAH